MASAAGIIIATGVMTLANDYVQSNAPVNPATPVAPRINWRVIPATGVAAIIFAGIEQVNGTLGRGLAWLAFMTAFLFSANPAVTHTSPLQTLLNTLGY